MSTAVQCLHCLLLTMFMYKKSSHTERCRGNGSLADFPSVETRPSSFQASSDTVAAHIHRINALTHRTTNVINQSINTDTQYYKCY